MRPAPKEHHGGFTVGEFTVPAAESVHVCRLGSYLVFIVQVGIELYCPCYFGAVHVAYEALAVRADQRTASSCHPVFKPGRPGSRQLDSPLGHVAVGVFNGQLLGGGEQIFPGPVFFRVRHRGCVKKGFVVIHSQGGIVFGEQVLLAVNLARIQQPRQVNAAIEAAFLQVGIQGDKGILGDERRHCIIPNLHDIRGGFGRELGEQAGIIIPSRNRLKLNDHIRVQVLKVLDDLLVRGQPVAAIPCAGADDDGTVSGCRCGRNGWGACCEHQAENCCDY